MKIIVGSHTCKLAEEPTEIEFGLIREATKFEPSQGSYIAKNKFITKNGKKVFNKQYKEDPYKYLYHKSQRVFPTGLLPKILEIYPDAELEDTRSDVAVHPHGLTSLRPYQAQLVDTLLANERAAGEIPTGTGKSWVCAALVNATHPSGLVLVTVPSTKLLRQTIKTLGVALPKGVRIGQWGSGKNKIQDVDVIVATIQAITAGKGKAENQEVLNRIRTWVLDETHGAAAKSYVDASKLMPNARRRYGVTATWRREDGTALVLEGMVGPLVFKYTPAQAIEDGWLVKPTIELHHYRNHENTHPKPRYSDTFMRKAIYFHEDRNAYVVSQIERCVQEGRTPCLVLVESLDHGDELVKLTGYTFVDGQRTKTKDLDEITEKFARNEIPVLIASRIFNVGVDIPEVRSLVLPASGKSVTTVMQRLGRALRLDEGKDTVLVIDIFDHEPHYLEKHAYERRFTYASFYPGTITDVRVPLAWKDSLAATVPVNTGP